MVNQPDADLDSDPSGKSDSPGQPDEDKQKAGAGTADSAGDFAGTAGTGGENKVQDQSFER